MTIMDRLCQTKGNDNRGSRRVVQVRFLIYSFSYSLFILSQDGRHIFTRPPLPPQPPPTMIIMTKGSRQRVRVSTHRCVFLFIPLYIYIYFSTYFISGRPPHLHSTTTTSTTTSNNKGLKTRRVLSPLVLSYINPHSHHHIDVPTHDCRFRRRCMTNGGSRHVYISSTGFFLLLCVVYLLKNL